MVLSALCMYLLQENAALLALGFIIKLARRTRGRDCTGRNKKMKGLQRERWQREGLKCYREEQHPFLRVNGIDQ